MGLLDAFMPGETGGMPNSNNFLNFLQTPQGQALASGIASYAAGARRGTPINNIGRGLLGGVSGYGDAIKSRQEAERQAQTLAYNKKQQELLGIHYDTERMRAEAARRASEQKRAETEGFNKFALPGFQKAVGYQIPVQGFDEEGNPVFGDSEGQIIPAAFEQQGGFLSTLDPDMRAALEAGLADPKTRGIAYRQMFDMYKGQKKIGQGQGKRLTNVQQGKDGKMYGLDPELGQFVEIPGRFQPAEKQPLVKIQGPFNEGEKGFKHELSLRSDFRQEPMYKAYQQVESAYRQINAGLDKISPAGDMAAATKVMKLLDPESVVRESELAMAMEATGLLDRITSYADRTLKGEKLTPNQRKDFRDLADKLFDQAAESYNAKRNEYEKIAKDYGFDPERAFGKPAMKPRFAAKPVQQAQPAPSSGRNVDDLLKKYGGK